MLAKMGAFVLRMLPEALQKGSGGVVQKGTAGRRRYQAGRLGKAAPTVLAGK